MLTEEWRTLVYPLGFIASLFFAGRFLIQWLQSELQRKSIVNRSFWILSLLGNSTITLHSILQGQMHLSLLQTTNGVIAWRNLNLLKPQEKQFRLFTVILLFLIVQVLLIGIFVLLNQAEEGTRWIRIPTAPWTAQESKEVSGLWHSVGFLSYGLFCARFWVQWWSAERQRKSHVSPLFWWMSLAGGLLSLTYFMLLGDLVNLIGPGFGLIPYLRNLVLIYRKRRTLPSSTSH